MNNICSNIDNLVSAYIDGQLNNDEEAEFMEHLGTCIECKSEAESISGIVTLLNNLVEDELPETFTHDLHEKLVLESKKMSRHKILRSPFIKLTSVAAACILIVFVIKAGIMPNFYMSKAMDDSASFEGAAGSAQKMEAYDGGSNVMMAADERKAVTGQKDTDNETENNKDIMSFSIDYTEQDSNEVDGVASMSVNTPEVMDIEVLAQKPHEQWPEIIEYIASVEVQVLEEKESGTAINILITSDKLNLITQYLEEKFDSENVKLASADAQEVQETIVKLNKQLERIDTRLDEIKKYRSSNPEDVTAIEEEKYDIEEQLKLYECNGDCTFISITITQK